MKTDEDNKVSAAIRPPVLVLDDHADVAATLAAICRRLGYPALIADQPGDIRALLEQHRPAALIIDVMMPEQDGYEALKVIAAFDRDLPVLLVSGYGDTWLEVGLTLGRGHGMTALETAAKPVRTEALRRFLALLDPPA